MTDIRFTQSGSDQRNETDANTARPKPARQVPSEFLRELQSAASMVMSREECAELEKELQQLRSHHSAAA